MWHRSNASSRCHPVREGKLEVRFRKNQLQVPLRSSKLPRPQPKKLPTPGSKNRRERNGARHNNGTALPHASPKSNWTCLMGIQQTGMTMRRPSRRTVTMWHQSQPRECNFWRATLLQGYARALRNIWRTHTNTPRPSKPCDGCTGTQSWSPALTLPNWWRSRQWGAVTARASLPFRQTCATVSHR